MIKIATINDLPELNKIAEEFVAESGWGWTFDEDNSTETFFNYISSPETAVVLVGDDGSNFVGLASLAWDREYHKERVGYLSKFYVNKNGRGTTASRELVSFCMSWFADNNCKAIFATSTANVGQEALFSNLLQKFGFEKTGPTLVWRNT